MGKIDFDSIKKLSSLTGVGVTEAKKALEAFQGDFDKAFDDMRAKGLAKAEKKATRTTKAGLIDSYVHGGRIGVLVEVDCETDFVAKTEEFKQFVHDICLQIAASAPSYVSREDIPKSDIAKEEKLERKALEAEGKPAKIINEIIKGRMEKYYETVCLLDQSYVRDPEKKVRDLLQGLIAKLGENIVISRFGRLELGVSD